MIETGVNRPRVRRRTPFSEGPASASLAVGPTDVMVLRKAATAVYAIGRRKGCDPAEIRDVLDMLFAPVGGTHTAAKTHRCADCDVLVDKNATRCRSCHTKRRRGETT